MRRELSVSSKGLARLENATASRPVAASITGLHSVHCVCPQGAPQMGHARHRSMKGSSLLQRSHKSSPGSSQMAQRVGQSVSATACAAASA